MKRRILVSFCVLHAISAAALTLFAFLLMAQTHTQDVFNELKEVLYWDVSALFFIAWALSRRAVLFSKICGYVTVISYILAAFYVHTLTHIANEYDIIAVVIFAVALLLTWPLFSKDTP